VPDTDLENIKSELPKHIDLTRKEEGCVVFEVIQDTDNPNKFSVYEEFINDKAFEFHQQRVRNSTWSSVTGNVKRNYEITKA
jgi:(4S)-4-hydroxy-5-phosphonooxypentane-2,3-dione isomerase